MKEIVEKIEKFLENHSNNVITISDGNRKLAKNTTKLRYAFTLEDIIEKFGSVEELIQVLPTKGFSNGTIVQFRRYYGNGNYSYHNHEEVTLNFKTKMDHNYQDKEPSNSFPNGMGYTSVAQNEWINSKVKESRFDDIERELRRTQDELADTKSQLRIANEKNNSLQLELNTAERNFDLKLQQELLNKKGFFESPAFEKMTEAMGAVLPTLMASQVAPSALGSPNQNLSQAKQSLITAIQQDIVSDEMVQKLLMNLQDFFNQEVEEKQKTDE